LQDKMLPQFFAILASVTTVLGAYRQPIDVLRGSKRLDIFAAGTEKYPDAPVYTSYWSPPDSWVPDVKDDEDYPGMTAIGTPGGSVYFGPKAVSVADQTYVFVATGEPRGSVRYGLQVKYATWNGKAWSNFTALPDPPSQLEKGDVKLSNGFSIARLPDNKRLQLVAVTEEFKLARITLEGTKWSLWETLQDDEEDAGGGFLDVPYVVSEGGDKLGYYAQRYENSSIAYKQWDGSKFVPAGKAWLHITVPDLGHEYIEGVVFSSPPDLSSQHVWLLISNYTLLHATVSGGRLNSFESLGDASTAVPVVSHRDSTSIDITGFSYEKYAATFRSFDGKKWSEWQTIKQDTIGRRVEQAAPAVGFFPPNNLHVFDVTFTPFVGSAGIVSNHKNNGTWYPKLDERDEYLQYYPLKAEKTNILSDVASTEQQVLKQWL